MKNQLAKTLFGRGSKLFIATLLTATIAPQILSITPAFADDGGYSWAGATYTGTQWTWGYSPTCPSSDPNCMTMTDNGYGTADPWVYSLRNCTSYAAWKINQVFGVSNISGWGNAATWDTGVPPNHPQPYTVYSPSNYTPQVGDLAQWGTEVASGFGHVAYVYSVSNGIASLDEYNSGLPRDINGNLQWGLFYGGRTTASNSAGTPDHYIHIGTLPTAASYIVKLGSDGTQYAKAGLGDDWTTLTTVATDIGASSSRFAYTDSSGTLHVKDGLNGSWYSEGTYSKYVVTPTLVVKLGSDGTEYAKAGLGDSWTTLTTVATDIGADGSRFAYTDSSGTLYVKDGLSGSWYSEGTYTKYILTSASD